MDYTGDRSNRRYRWASYRSASQDRALASRVWPVREAQPMKGIGPRQTGQGAMQSEASFQRYQISCQVVDVRIGVLVEQFDVFSERVDCRHLDPRYAVEGTGLARLLTKSHREVVDAD